MEVTPEEVIKRVRAAGGRLVLKGLEAEELAVWRHASKVAYLRLLRAGHERLQRWGEPGTLHLVLERLDEEPPPLDDATLEALGEKERERTVPRTEEFLGRRVPVPSKVTNPHPIVEQLVRELDRPERSIYGPDFGWRAPRPGYPLVKMRRIWQALINEAAFRGYTVRFAVEHQDRYDRGKLVVRIDWDEFPMELYGDRGHALTLTIKERHPQKKRGYDSWIETPERPLHTQLGEVFTHIERWADLLIQKREQEYKKELEDRRRRERIEADARKLYAEGHRRAVLTKRIAEVEFADDVRAYSKALRAAAEGLSPARADSVRAWARWAHDHADHVDPRRRLKSMPEELSPTRDELKPYLPNNGLWY